MSTVREAITDGSVDMTDGLPVRRKVSEIVTDLAARVIVLEARVNTLAGWLERLDPEDELMDDPMSPTPTPATPQGVAEDDDPRVREARERLARDEQNPNAFGLDATLAEGRRAQAVVGDKEIEVVLPPVDEKRVTYRRQQAEQMGLEDNFPGIDATEAYVKGGPLWLYHGNRDFVMGLPEEMRKLMVQDVEIDSPQEAHEMAHDLLKKREQAGSHSLEAMLDG